MTPAHLATLRNERDRQLEQLARGTSANRLRATALVDALDAAIGCGERESPDETCAYDECEAPATDLAAARESERSARGYCRAHAEIVADSSSPEYVVECPHCGCAFGVN